EPRQVAGAFVVQPLFATAERRDVAVQVEDGKRVALLQHGAPLARQRGGGEDVVLVLNLNDIFHFKWGSAPHPRSALLAAPLPRRRSVRAYLRHRAPPHTPARRAPPHTAARRFAGARCPAPLLLYLGLCPRPRARLLTMPGSAYLSLVEGPPQPPYAAKGA